MSVFLLFLTLAFIVPPASALGLAPCEMRVENSYGSGVVGTMVLVNSDNEPRWIRLQIQIPSTRITEKKHLRVICEDCHDSHQRYEVIPDYVPEEIDANLSGICPKCSSANLTFFELPPESVLKNITLGGRDCILISEGDGIYRISEKLDYREERNIGIIFNIPEKSEYSDRHYEVHVLATSYTDDETGFGIIPGIIMRLLIDNPEIVVTGSFDVDVKTVGIIGTIGGSILVVVFVIRKMPKKSHKMKKQGIPKVKPEPVKVKENPYEPKRPTSPDDIERFIDGIG